MVTLYAQFRKGVFTVIIHFKLTTMKYVCPLVDITEERLETVPREPLMWGYRSNKYYIYCVAFELLVEDYYFDN